MHFDLSLDKTVLGTYSDTHSGSEYSLGKPPTKQRLHQLTRAKYKKQILIDPTNIHQHFTCLVGSIRKILGWLKEEKLTN